MEPRLARLVFKTNPSITMAKKKQKKSKQARAAEMRSRSAGQAQGAKGNSVKASSTSVDTSTKRRRARSSDSAKMPFSKKNYVLLAIGVGIIIFGYTIMRMDNQVDGFISLYVAPILLLIGYLEIFYAIWWREKDSSDANQTSAV